MKVMETNVNYVRQAYSNEAVAPQQQEQQANQQVKSNEMPEDKVSISADSQEMKVAREAVDAAPEVRTEKVNELKEAVDQGTYQVNASNVADKMIGTRIDELI